MTTEDPVEYQLEGINQIQVHTQDRPDVRGSRCAVFCVTTPTWCWSAKFAIWKRPKTRSRRR
ncbi:MAG: hypothetical protein QM811_28795 [Pirellulales bacterium]